MKAISSAKTLPLSATKTDRRLGSMPLWPGAGRHAGNRPPAASKSFISRLLSCVTVSLSYAAVDFMTLVHSLLPQHGRVNQKMKNTHTVLIYRLFHANTQIGNFLRVIWLRVRRGLALKKKQRCDLYTCIHQLLQQFDLLTNKTTLCKAPELQKISRSILPRSSLECF